MACGRTRSPASPPRQRPCSPPRIRPCGTPVKAAENSPTVIPPRSLPAPGLVMRLPDSLRQSKCVTVPSASALPTIRSRARLIRLADVGPREPDATCPVCRCETCLQFTTGQRRTQDPLGPHSASVSECSFSQTRCLRCSGIIPATSAQYSFEWFGSSKWQSSWTIR